MPKCKCGVEIPSGKQCPRCHAHALFDVLMDEDASQELARTIEDVGYIEIKVGFVRGFCGRTCGPGDPLPPGWVRGSYVRSMLSSKADNQLLKAAKVNRELFEGWMVEKRHADSLLKVMHEDRPDLVSTVPPRAGCLTILLVAFGVGLIAALLT